jgi:hypothetical protein
MGDPKKKNEETVSSIVVDEFSSAVPGVTMLLNPQVILEREASRVKMERSDPVAETFSPDNEGIVLSSPSAAEPAAEPVVQTVFDDTPLSQLGVLLELHFEDEGAGFRFLKIVPHAQGPAAEWQEVAYRGMRIELDVLGINISFQEFSAKKDSFHADAFCAADDAWIQIVRSREHSTRMYVLITRRSLLLEKEKVYTLLEGSGEKESGDDSDGGGIEIDFAS